MRWWPAWALVALSCSAACSEKEPRDRPGTPGPGPTTGCQSLLDKLGKDRVMVGARMNDASAAAAPFDVRYIYISGGTFDGEQACTSCASSCTARGQSCANASGGCAWWGCWQWDQVPPGAFVRDFIERCADDEQIPMVTYYQLLHASGVPEGAPEIHALDDDEMMRRYYADYRVLLENIGQTRAILHLEPDLWGYAQHVGSDPHAVPAAVARINADCSDLANTVAGFGRCLIAMARKRAPNTLVGLHASSWGTLIDVLGNTDPAFDLAAEGDKLGDFLIEVGAGTGDFIATDASDRDAGYDGSFGQDNFWDDTNATLPNFHQAFAWGKAVAESVGLPLMWWQVPVGNMSLPNTTTRWHDNRLDYFFAHVAEIEAGHGVGMFFGAGNDEQTTPETDGGNLIAKVNAYAASGETFTCQ